MIGCKIFNQIARSPTANSVATIMHTGSTMVNPRCLWCDSPFKPRRGGSRQRFCKPGHRTAFHTAARLWAEHEAASGALTIADLRDGTHRPCAVRSCAGTRQAAFPPDHVERFTVEIPRT